MAAIPIGEVIKWIAIGIMVVTGFATASNVVGSITGVNPMAHTMGTLMQTLLPLIVTMMPIMMIMNMFMSMIQGIMAPFTRMAALVSPPVYY